MSIACGVDIESICRLEDIVRRSLFPKDVLLPREWEYIQSANLEVGLYFTIKEAMLKALGIGWLYGPAMGNDIEIQFNTEGKFELILHGEIKKIFVQKGYHNIEINYLEYNRNFLASVILVKDKHTYISSQTIVDVCQQPKGINPKKILRANEERVCCEGAMMRYVAGRLAVKQSIAFLIERINGESMENRIYDIEIANDFLGRPFINNIKTLKHNSDVAISITHSKQYAVGLAAVII
jgi:phosphopantetheine--protein transferase-like protein